MMQIAKSTVRPNRDRFFIALSAMMLLIVLVGFSPTFFLHRLFGEAPLPTYLHVHGVILTAWFCLAFAQTCLIATGRMAAHRRIGVASVFVAIAVVAINLVTLGIRATSGRIRGSRWLCSAANSTSTRSLLRKTNKAGDALGSGIDFDFCTGD